MQNYPLKICIVYIIVCVYITFVHIIIIPMSPSAATCPQYPVQTIPRLDVTLYNWRARKTLSGMYKFEPLYMCCTYICMDGCT